jgi:MATE family multidrug resistance protein
LLQGSEEIKELAITYYHIRIWAAPANMLLYCFNGWFVGMQNTKFPMITAITINIFNIIFSAFFVLAMHLDVEGVALGTVLAQYCGLALTLTLFLIRYRNILMPLNRRTLLDLSKIKRFFHVNIDLMIRSFLLIITIAFFTNQSATLGDNILAVNMILIQFFYIFSYFTDGFAYAGEALVGRYTGASDIDNIKKVIKYLFLWGITISLPFTLIYTLFPDVIVRLISNDPTITEAVKPYHIYMIIMPLATFAAFLWDGVYIGATASRAIRNTMIISTILVFLPCWYYLTDYGHRFSLS